MAKKVIEADLCIVGSGVAGSIVAEKLAGRAGRIVILERGKRTTFEESLRRVEKGEQSAPQTPLQPEVISVGKHTTPLYSVAAVGGSTMQWWGQTPRFAPSDFKLASTYGVGVDWPIGYDEIEPFYGRAEQELGIAGSVADAPWPRTGEYPCPAQPLSPHEELLARELGTLGVTVKRVPMARPSTPQRGRPACCGSGTCAPFCPSGAKYTALGAHVRDAEAKGVTIVSSVRANVLVAKKERIDHLLAHDLDHNQVEVRARRFVLAANATETPRLLLLSAAHDPTFRASPVVGQHFMDHPHLEMHGTSTRDLRRGYGPTPSNGTSYDFYDGPHRSTRAAALLELLNWRVGPHEVAASTVSALRRGARGAAVTGSSGQRWRGNFQLGFQMEMLPSPDNRISLHPTERDVYGLPRLQCAIDMWPTYVERTAEEGRKLGRKLAAALGGTIDLRERYTSFHMMGTCRMGTTFETSVVDRDLRHHAYENLHVVGSSVFPTSGAANPTLLIAALCLRFADHLAV